MVDQKGIFPFQRPCSEADYITQITRGGLHILQAFMVTCEGRGGVEGVPEGTQGRGLTNLLFFVGCMVGHYNCGRRSRLPFKFLKIKWRYIWRQRNLFWSLKFHPKGRMVKIRKPEMLLKINKSQSNYQTKKFTRSVLLTCWGAGLEGWKPLASSITFLSSFGYQSIKAMMKKNILKS